METSRKSAGPNSNPSISSAEGSPARISARPESGLGLKALVAAFGLSSPVSLGSFDPDTFLLRTSQACLFLEQCPEWSESWPDSGMWDCGGVYELQSSAPVTCESESSLWPTTRASSGGGNRSGYEGAPYRPALAQKAQTWNTSSTEDHKTDGPAALARYERGEAMTCDMRLRNQATCWPTARREDGESCGNHPGAMDSLTGATKLWGTPQAHERQADPRDVDHGVQLANQADTWRSPDAPGQGGPRNRQDSIGEGHQVTIAEQAEHWPTPDLQDTHHGTRGASPERIAKRQAGGRQLSMEETVSIWQTPATDSFRSRGGDRQDEQGLDQQARMFPTPGARDYRTPNARSYQDRGGVKVEQLPNFVAHSLPAPATPDGPPSSKPIQTSRRRLNPRFVEWLMGFPAGWSKP